ncbi:MAG: AI-2E family transporter [Lachnospiraceae bacterium]|jgi:predicted PurR-regulated permease PerM|nr:AI-2E family transporter [Lachnospiraceae bacterium]
MKRERFLRYLYISLTVAGAIVLSISFFFLLFRFQEVQKGIHTLLGILMPFIYGAVIAYLLTPVCNACERWVGPFFQKHMKSESRAQKLSGALGIFLSLGMALLVFYLLLAMVLPQVFYSVKGIVVVLPSNVEKWTLWLEQFVSDNQAMVNYLEWASDELLNNLDEFIRNSLLPNMQMIVSGVSSGVISVVVVLKNLLIGIIAAVYMMGSRKQFAAQMKKLIYSMFKREHANLVIDEIHFMDKVFGGFIVGKLLDSLIIGCICFICMSLMKMPYAMLVSVIVGVTNIIPFFGPYFGAIPSALLILMVDPRQCIYFLIFILILQQFDGNILGPRILGNSTGLSGFWVLFSILLFGGLMGFIGMVIGVPTFAVIYNLVKRISEYSLQRKDLSCETGDYAGLRRVTGDAPKQYIYEEAKPKEPKKEKEADREA